MIDHLLGRPSPGWKRSQVLLTSALCLYLLRKSNNGRLYKKLLRPIDSLFAHTKPWKVVLATITTLYLFQHSLLLLFLNPPEPLAKMYTRNFFRATWIMTALDAGFLTAGNIKSRWLRDLMGPMLSIVYLLFPESANQIVQKYHWSASIDVMRTSWEKTSNPILWFFIRLSAGYLGVRKDIHIPMPNPPSSTAFKGTPRKFIEARLYFDGTAEQLSKSTRLILQIPGGGFVTMGPKNHEDYVTQWAKRTRVPIVSINYGKAPEFPYPYALEECFDAYRSIVESNGECIGMEGWFTKDSQGRALHRKAPIRIVLVGDSA